MPRLSNWNTASVLPSANSLYVCASSSGMFSNANPSWPLWRERMKSLAISRMVRVGQAQKVELHQAGGLHVVLVVLAHRPNRCPAAGTAA
jgi:hypothetical protein